MSEGRQPTDLLKLVDNLPGVVYRCANDKKWTMKFISQGSKSLLLPVI